MMSGFLAIVSVHMEWHLLTRMEHRVVTACEHSLTYVLVGLEWCLGQYWVLIWTLLSDFL